MTLRLRRRLPLAIPFNRIATFASYQVSLASDSKCAQTLAWWRLTSRSSESGKVIELIKKVLDGGGAVVNDAAGFVAGVRQLCSQQLRHNWQMSLELAQQPIRLI